MMEDWEIKIIDKKLDEIEKELLHLNKQIKRNQELTEILTYRLRGALRLVGVFIGLSIIVIVAGLIQ